MIYAIILDMQPKFSIKRCIMGRADPDVLAFCGPDFLRVGDLDFNHGTPALEAMCCASAPTCDEFYEMMQEKVPHRVYARLRDPVRAWSGPGSAELYCARQGG